MAIELAVGMVGAGYAAHRRAQAIRALKSGRVAVKGVFDVNETHASEFARELRVKHHRSLDELLNDREINTIAVAVPNRFHYDIVKKGLLKNRHVLCEYPLVLDAYKTGEELVGLAKKKGLFLHVGQTMNYDADYRFIEAHSKEIGEPLIGYRYLSFGPLGSWFTAEGFKGKYSGLGSWYVDHNVKRGWIVSSHYHGIQVFRKVFGEVVSVCAIDTSSAERASASLLLRHEKGATTAIQWVMPAGGKVFNKTIVTGKEGSIEIEGDGYEIDAGSTHKKGKLKAVDTFVIDLEVLLDELDGKRDIELEQRDMLRNLKTAICAQESAQRGRQVRV